MLRFIFRYQLIKVLRLKSFLETVLFHPRLGIKKKRVIRESLDDFYRQRFFTISPRIFHWRYETGFLVVRCDIPWFRITRWRKPPYRVTLVLQTHNVTRLWCREVHKCSQVQQRVCIRYVCILYIVYTVYPLSYTFATISVYASKYTRRQCFLSIFVTCAQLKALGIYKLVQNELKIIILHDICHSL